MYGERYIDQGSCKTLYSISSLATYFQCPSCQQTRHQPPHFRHQLYLLPLYPKQATRPITLQRLQKLHHLTCPSALPPVRPHGLPKTHPQPPQPLLPSHRLRPLLNCHQMYRVANLQKCRPRSHPLNRRSLLRAVSTHRTIHLRHHRFHKCLRRFPQVYHHQSLQHQLILLNSHPPNHRNPPILRLLPQRPRRRHPPRALRLPIYRLLHHQNRKFRPKRHQEFHL
mmetsp:Transcript_46860/g.71675  ORF Transcript_46860/g.71675 Transcript_46860/m.71675 type:complete len:225 (-) Transcript_46860:164-838(-)